MKKQPITREEVDRARAKLQDSSAAVRSELTDVAGKVGSGLKRGTKRFLVHAAGLFFFGPAIGALTTDAVDPGMAGFLAYLAFICLLPRAPMNDRSWYIPSAAGFVEWALAAIVGTPLAVGAFLGGIQAFAMRAILKKFKMGSEWGAAFFILVGLTALIRSSALPALSWAALVPMIPITAAGWLVDRAMDRLAEAQAKKRLTETIAGRFKELSGRDELGANILLELSVLAARAGSFFTVIDKGGHSDDEVLGRVDRLSLDLFGATADQPDSEKLLERMQDLSDELDQIVQKRGGPSSGIIDEFRGYEQQVRELLIAKRDLDPAAVRHVDTIAAAAHGIIRQMRSDPSDKAAGERFLRRYLKATAEVVGERKRLEQATASNRTEAMRTALARSDEVLEHMASAFRDEEQFLMNNDTVNFTAQLNALDTFMKMRGH